ncbi:MAG: hypothetical protein AB1Z22_12745 [Synechococcaceae cyanobacterium]
MDTSVWVEHLRRGLPRLVTLLQEGEVLPLIERERLMGRGIGYVDAHLLACARLSHCRLWTQDRRLAAVALEQGVAAQDIDVQAATTDEEPAEG